MCNNCIMMVRPVLYHKKLNQKFYKLILVNKVEKLSTLYQFISFMFLDMLEAMPPPSATLEAAPPLNIVTHQLNTEGQFATLCAVLMYALDITSACTVQGENPCRPKKCFPLSTSVVQPRGTKYGLCVLSFKSKR